MGISFLSTYIIHRVLQMIPVVIGTTFLIYVMVFAIPGDPTAGKCGDRACPPSVVAAITEKYHLDDPVPVGYAKYMANVLQGDLGENRFGIPVADDLKKPVPDHLEACRDGSPDRDHHRHPRRRAHGHQTRGFPGQPRAGEHPRSDLHTGLRHRGTRPADVRREAGLVPRHRAQPGDVVLPRAPGHRARLVLAGLRHPPDQGKPHREPQGGLRAHRQGKGSDTQLAPSGCTPCATH